MNVENIIIQVHCPVVVSSSVTYAVDITKLLKHYERICAYTYTKHIIKYATSGLTSKMITVQRAVGFLMPLAGLITGALGVYILRKYYGVSSIGRAIGVVLGLAKIGDAKDTTTQKQPSTTTQKKPLLENKGKDDKGVDITTVKIDDNLKVQYIAHVTQNTINTTTKQVLNQSLAKNVDNLVRKLERIAVTQETDIVTLALNKICYIINASEEEEIKELTEHKKPNYIIVDFTNDIVKTEIRTLNDQVITYFSKISDVLMKPNVEDISVSDLVNLLNKVKVVNSGT